MLIIGLVSFGTHANIMHNIYNSIDLTSFPNSLIPRVTNNEKHFSDFKDGSKLPNPEFTSDSFIMEDDSWFYKYKLIEQVGDDFYLCVWDQAKQSRYNAIYPIVIRKYGNDFVALALDPTPTDGSCKRVLR